MAIGDPFTTALPPVGSVGPQFASDINSILTEVMLRLSTKIPALSINFNSDQNLAGSALTNAGYLTLANTAATPGSSPVNRLTAFGGDLYYVSPSGVIQLTSGALLNSAAIGGITGDYGGVNPAQFRYDSINTRYDAYANFSTGTWASVRAKNLQMTASPTSTVTATLSWVGNAANKSFTLPTAPTTTLQLPMYMDTAGNMTPGHASRPYAFSPSGGSWTQLGVTYFFSTGSGNGTGIQKTSAAAAEWVIPASFPVGTNITSVAFNVFKNNGNTVVGEFRRVAAGASATNDLAIASVTSTATGQLSLVAPLGVPETVVAGSAYHFSFQFGPSANQEILHNIVATTTMPA